MKSIGSLVVRNLVSIITTIAISLSMFPVISKADEKNDATHYEIGSTINATITEDSPELYYVFELEESGEVEAELRLGTWDQYAYQLYDDYGNKLYGEYRGNHTGDFRWVLTSGTYYLIFYDNYSSYGTFTFETSYKSANVNHDEGNSEKNNAAAIDLNKKYNSIICANKESEYFKFELEESGEVEAELRLGTWDQYAYSLYDDYGNKLYGETYGNHTGDFRWVLTSGTYYLIFYNMASSYGTFTFETSYKSANVNHNEGNSEKNNATTIDLNKKYNSIICANKESEYFKFKLEESGEVEAELRLGTWDQYAYSLYDDYGNKLYGESYGNHDGEFKWVLSSGIYYLRFYNVASSYGTFSFGLYDGMKDTNDEDDWEEQKPEPDDDENNTQKPDNDDDNDWEEEQKPNPDEDEDNTDSSDDKIEYWDVDENDDYFKAISELSSKGIIDGYDDGSFKPENKLTRAEFAKLVVGLLDRFDEAQNKKGNTGFYDVKSSHWASGYINVCVNLGIIDGYDSTTFGPEDNVTYAQTVKMLVEAAGYGTQATRNGGWPSGYIKTGNSIGITDGVSKSNDTIISRGDAAILMYNTLLIME